MIYSQFITFSNACILLPHSTHTRMLGKNRGWVIFKNVLYTE